MQKVPFWEKIAFALGDSGCNFVWSTMSFFLTVYLTDSVGIAAMTVGNIMLISRLLDGFTDLGMGTLIDNTNSKYGKARVWILRSAPFLSIGLIALFNVPESLTYTAKVAYVSVAYVFVAAFAYTATNLSYSALLSFITDDQQERATLTAMRFIAVVFTVIFISIFTPKLMASIGISKVSYIYGFISLVLLLITFFGTHERNVVEVKEEDKTSVKENIGILFKNKYFISVTLLYIALFTYNSLLNGSAYYFARDILGNGQYTGLLTIAISLPSLLVMFVYAPLVKKFGKWKLMFVGAILVMAGGLVVGLSVTMQILPLTILGSIIRGLGTAPITVGIFAIVADIVDYGEWKSGVRIEGLTYSATSFGMKVGSGLGAALVGWLLAFAKYDSTLELQSDFTLTVMSWMYIYVPVIIAGLCLVILLSLNLDKEYDKISKDLKERRKNNQ